MNNASGSIGSSLLTQSTVLVDGLYLPDVSLSIAFKGSLLGESSHLSVLGYYIADGIRHSLPGQLAVSTLHNRSVASFAQQVGLPVVIAAHHVLQRVLSSLLGSQRILDAIFLHLLVTIHIVVV